jgi:hypothetical protein
LAFSWIQLRWDEYGFQPITQGNEDYVVLRSEKLAELQRRAEVAYEALEKAAKWDAFEASRQPRNVYHTVLLDREAMLASLAKPGDFESVVRTESAKALKLAAPDFEDGPSPVRK